MTDCEHLLTLVMGSDITDEGRDAFRQNAERLLPHYYERAREDEILMIGMEQSQYWVLREMYLDLADDCYRGLYSRGLIFPDFDRKNLDYGYAYWLQKYDSEFFEHKNIARLHLLDGPVQQEIDHGSRPCPCRNCDGNCTRDLLDADIRRSRPVAASQGAPTPPTGIEKISIAERCERISLWKDMGLSKMHRDPKEYPFEVGIPAHISKEEQLRLFKSEEHTESVAEYLDERLRIIWTEHNGSTFLTVIKKPATCSPLREIETYDVPWRCLLDYSTELLKGRKPTLLEHFKTWHVDSMDAADKCKQRLVLHERLYAHRQSQQREEGWRKKLIDHVKKRTAQICKDTQNSSLERATGITKLWTTTGCYKKTPLSLEDVGYCIMSAWGSFDGDGRVIENAKQASAWLWKTRNLSREYLEQQPSLAELVTKLGLDEIIPDVSNDGRRDNA
ncbi:hypothetical protein CkaCkLH20_03582 [Colletotrichum karsti]|uniref:Uncharacterized protein n=1 Tax=Colletotrichum karsti TaxID=1095194 RepID=A0A9P6I869_9PEZI|nr:uncharacterized protein CkaCkLH20_03582 [Colletotrichum karsti]KAF9878682.1 hypothetical protein CkaCkLH20_03582 [Colletotrichum karsti]